MRIWINATRGLERLAHSAAACREWWRRENQERRADGAAWLERRWYWLVATAGVVLFVLMGLMRLVGLQRTAKFFLWTDNVFVAAYTVVFLALVAQAYRQITQLDSVRILVWRLWLVITLVAALSGGLVDYVENFCLLSDGEVSCPLRRLEIWKICLFVANLSASVVWTAVARSRTRKTRLRLSKLGIEKSLREKFGNNVDWPEELVGPRAVSGGVPWRLAFYAHFIDDHLGKPGRYSFSRRSVEYFLHEFCGAQFPDNSTLIREASVFLAELGRKYYIRPSGDRLEVMADKLPPWRR